jgi:AcrR family transcriptional regulator
MDLRQRRKIETTRLIHEAAVALAREQGVAAVTIEAICAAAGISQRTFFNYFPFKEAVFVFPPPALPPDAVARFAASTGDLVADLSDLLVAQAAHINPYRWVGPVMREIAEAHPRLMPLQIAEFHKFEAEVTLLVAARMGVPETDVNAVALVAAILAAGRTAIDRWRDDDAADLPQLMRESHEALVKTIRG